MRHPVTNARNQLFISLAGPFAGFALGIPALVLGPGHIEQAHVVDEWVSLAQLDRALETYSQLVAGHG